MNNKQDWTGNSKSTYAPLAASNHTDHDRQKHDLYCTHPQALKDFLNAYRDRDHNVISNNIWESASGLMHLVKVLQDQHYNVIASDAWDYGTGARTIDFLEDEPIDMNGIDILTNPPYGIINDWTKRGLEILENGQRMFLLVKIQFLETLARREIFDVNPPKFIYVYSKRQLCAMNGNFENYASSAVCYAWAVFEKGYRGDTIVKWI
jgi:hypothetical protein